MAHEGTKLDLTCNGQTVGAWIVMASENRLSLMVAFEAILDGCVGMMPIYTAKDGTTRNLITDAEVQIKWIEGAA